MYSCSVTFICSKTDDISLMEAQEALGLDEEMSESWLEMDGFAKKVEALEKEMNELKDTKATFGDILNDAEDQAETWEAIKDSFDDGKTVFAPMDKSARRKRKADCSSRARKRQRRAGESEAEETGDSNCEESSASEHGTEGFDTGDEDTREPLDEERIVAKINEIRTTKKEARNQRADITEKMVSIRKQIEEARASEKSIEAEISSLCISGRNQYSRGAIQQVGE